MDAHAVRSEGDTTLFAELQEHPIVRDVLKQLEKREGSLGTRRSLLATALRLTPAISPDIHAILTHCRATLQVDTEIELFVYASPSYNAACARPEGGRVFVLLASSLMEAFDREELQFVIGHELGHHVYDHHRIPVGMLTHPKAKVPASLILRLHAWQRYAEISADRAGLLCTGELSGAARALFKLSSGLSSAPNEARIQAFLDQATDLYQEAENTQQGERQVHHDWLSSHPFSPIRLRAAQAFTQSQPLCDTGKPLAELERDVQDLMALMEPSYLEEDSLGAESMRRLLYAAGTLIAAAHDGVIRAESRAMESLLGPSGLPKADSVDALRADLPRRLSDVTRHARSSRRLQLIRDLVLIARADGEIHTEELAILHTVTDGLNVDRALLQLALATPGELD